MDLDIDPLEIQSWEAYCVECILAGQLLMFRRKLNAYIKLTNKPVKDDLQAYAVRRHGEMVADELLRQRYGVNYRQVIADKK